MSEQPTTDRVTDERLDTLIRTHQHKLIHSHYEARRQIARDTIDALRELQRLRASPEPAAGHGWTCVTERLPTEDELKAGVLFGIHWPEGRIEMVSWDMEYQHDYDLMCLHFEVFQPDRSQGTGYWRTSASIAPPRSSTTKAGDA